MEDQTMPLQKWKAKEKEWVLKKIFFLVSLDLYNYDQ